MRSIYNSALAVIICAAGALVLFALAALLSSCSAIKQEMNADQYYRRTLKLTVNGQKFSGVGVVKRADAYSIAIESEDDMDFMRITTCHRDIDKEDLGDSYAINLIPMRGLDDKGSCPIQVEAFNKDGKHAWGFLAVEDEDSILPATVICNGTSKQSGGTSVCQSLAGLTQELSFSEAVEVPNSLRPACKLIYKIFENKLTYQIPPGACVYEFRGASGRWHRHFTHGYQNVVRVK